MTTSYLVQSSDCVAIVPPWTMTLSSQLQIFLLQSFVSFIFKLQTLFKASEMLDPVVAIQCILWMLCSWHWCSWSKDVPMSILPGCLGVVQINFVDLWRHLWLLVLMDLMTISLFSQAWDIIGPMVWYLIIFLTQSSHWHYLSTFLCAWQGLAIKMVGWASTKATIGSLKLLLVWMERLVMFLSRIQDCSMTWRFWNSMLMST